MMKKTAAGFVIILSIVAEFQTVVDSLFSGWRCLAGV
jgi:hypothetical protein